MLREACAIEGQKKFEEVQNSLSFRTVTRRKFIMTILAYLVNTDELIKSWNL